ncbi:MAG TPA: SRPBCC domain-containing protein [Mycobacterium sp.]|nr:SRPBCC domain-containing protein [Mycobacterium sp.]
MTNTRSVRHIRASRADVYRALVDATAIATWRVPDNMSAAVHVFDPRPGGEFRISLTYESPARRGKTAAHTDTYHGLFIELVPDERVVEELEFETSDPALHGAMRMTTALADADGGTDVIVLHEGLPPGVSARDNEIGTRMALDKLAALVESRVTRTPTGYSLRSKPKEGHA